MSENSMDDGSVQETSNKGYTLLAREPMPHLPKNMNSIKGMSCLTVLHPSISEKNSALSTAKDSVTSFI